MNVLNKISLLIICLSLSFKYSYAQKTELILKDTLDGKFDVGHVLVNAHGFVPIMMIITEPALGGFGLAVAPVFISPQKSKGNSDRFHFPDITAGIGLYTVNQTWLAGAFRMGSIPSLGLRYTVAGGVGDINLGFYRELPYVGEKEFTMNIDAKFGFVELARNVYHNRVFLGMNYMYGSTLFKSKTALLPPEHFAPKELDTRNGLLGGFFDIDYRNSIFTADKGLRFKTTYKISRDFTGSDFDFDRVESFAALFLQPTQKWVSAFRVDGQMVSSGAPFYAQPFLVMRGMPTMRYQGQQTFLVETEQRLDLTSRWSLVGFIGTGRAFSSSNLETDNQWHTSGGAGFRYLLARVFKLRAGVDIAKGPDQFAYYIVVGHSWNR